MDVPVSMQLRWVATVVIAGVSGHSSSHETGTGMAAMSVF